eukprot:gnl/MRDRNA2_/MRDRNA2_57104_c0_seq1.p1 gnl/MRDRNA2_/MRDRNA2_57104_c0~~gnl/MRDRNA2_/MRDRNA2_57104_c0_seq1.p1  ORF type:complete len:299 (+),score=48.36 gnl/MRDRNA2_/MRDRNA2_57104_c0_seq1:107-1003(+)
MQILFIHLLITVAITAERDAEGSVKSQRRGLRHLANFRSQDVMEHSTHNHNNTMTGSSALMSQALVHTDAEPLILDMSFISSSNPKNGTPWFRYKKVSEAGEADHSHFSGLTATGNFKEDIIRGHNVVRKRAGLESIEWSSALEKLAAHRLTELVNGGCYIKHSSTNYRWTAAGFKYVGENLYKVINMEPTGVDVADAWYAEIDDYTYGIVGQDCVKKKCRDRSSPPCAIGHFTQMMWQRTTHLGCARAECPNESKKTFLAICHYGPGGNIGGFMPFESNIASNIGFRSKLCKESYMR